MRLAAGAAERCDGAEPLAAESLPCAEADTSLGGVGGEQQSPQTVYSHALHQKVTEPSGRR
eukprot:2479570-Pyramimonas_sp.AAC.1